MVGAEVGRWREDWVGNWWYEGTWWWVVCFADARDSKRAPVVENGWLGRNTSSVKVAGKDSAELAWVEQWLGVSQ